jgi:RNA polymerase sigma-70 factor, ECF subfamily
VCHLSVSNTDSSLARAAAGGSRAAAAALFERHWPEARRVAHAVVGRHALAEDVAQDAMVQAFSAIRSFREDGSFSSWLRTIVVRRALNAVRSERRWVALDVAAAIGVDDTHILPNHELRAAFTTLSADQQVAVALRYGLDFSPAEVAAAVGVSVGTIHSRLSRALTLLRTNLEVADV